MSMNTLIAFIAGFAIVCGSIYIATDSPMAFIDLSSAMIVFGGTFSALFISFEFKTAAAAIKLMFQAFSKHDDTEIYLKDEIAQIIIWAYTLQKSGLQGLENEINAELKKEDPFLAYGAELVISGYTGAEVKQILDQRLKAKHELEDQAIEALKKMGGDAPAFGMLGTLIGLIIMLGSMKDNPAEIGSSMAIALVTTFYGIILARLMFIPLAVKAAQRNDVSLFKNTLQMEGLALLAERKSPRYIQDRINSFVEADDQFSIDRDLGISSTPQS